MPRTDYPYRVVPLEWPPHEQTPNSARIRSPFKQHQAKLEKDLDRELAHLGAADVTLGVDVDARYIRQDGQFYSNARPRSPAIELSFRSGKDRLRFRADRYPYWFDNLVAITRTMEALRGIDRWGVMQGKQYEGYKQLPERSGTTMTAERAAGVLSHFSGTADTRILGSATDARDAFRRARAKTHPDSGGSADAFALTGEAGRVLAAHHGLTSL